MSSAATAPRWRGPAATSGPPSSALVRVPTRTDSSIANVEILLSAPEPKQVTLRSGTSSVTIPVDSESIWCPVPLEGEPYDVVNNAGSVVLTDGHGADRGFGMPDGEQFGEEEELFAWCGGAVLLRSDYLADVGLLDERFFLYYEDTDLSWRGRARGWKYQFVPDATVRHVHAATTVEGSASFAYFTERNRLLMLLKNAPMPMVRTGRRGLSGPDLRRGATGHRRCRCARSTPECASGVAARACPRRIRPLGSERAARPSERAISAANRRQCAAQRAHPGLRGGVSGE